MGFVPGKTYHRPAIDDTWCIRALGEIAHTFGHPIRIRLTMSDGKVITGHLGSVESRFVTIDVPTERLAVRVRGDEVEAFRLLPEP